MGSTPTRRTKISVHRTVEFVVEDRGPIPGFWIAEVNGFVVLGAGKLQVGDPVFGDAKDAGAVKLGEVDARLIRVGPC